MERIWRRIGVPPKDSKVLEILAKDFKPYWGVPSKGTRNIGSNCIAAVAAKEFQASQELKSYLGFTFKGT